MELPKRNEVSNLLRSIGMVPKYSGYAYLILILRVSVAQHKEFLKLSTALYPVVSDSYGITEARVERNIRFAIQRAWDNPGNKAMHNLFNSFGITWTPTNGEFIAVLTECLLMTYDSDGDECFRSV